METVALSSKGQFVLPKSIRDQHHWDTGTKFVIIDRGNEVALKPINAFEPTEFEDPDTQPLYSGKRLSLADMDRAVAKEAGARK